MKLEPSAGDPLQTEDEVSKNGAVSSLDDIPEVARYLHRVNATPTNFRTAQVKEIDGGYPRNVGTIKFSSDGAVKVSGDVEAPSEEEAEKIKAAFTRYDLPKMVTLAAIGDGPPDCDLDDVNTFICHDFNNQVVMVHQRYHTLDGGKGFIPWTRWSDGKWRKMEPDVMPFYGLKGAKEHSTLYIHEGSKAAARVRRIIADRGRNAGRFPWFEEMQYGAHIGWIGGVHAVGSSDWDSLAKIGWKRVMIVADNDDNKKGEVAAKNIALKFSCPTYIVAFDSRFNDGHDCGDDWPEVMFDEEGKYTGPKMEEFLRPAMKAVGTMPPEPGRRGRPPTFLLSSFAEKVAYSVKPPLFMFRDNPSRTYTDSEFNAKTAPFSDDRDGTASKVRGVDHCQHDLIVYDCGNAPGTLVSSEGRGWNVFRPTRVKPSQGSEEPWLDYLGRLLPVEIDRVHFMRWVATLIAKPEVRMRYGVLLISERQGAGKSTLAHVLAPLIGRDNMSRPNESAVVDSQFNSWQSRKRLVFIDEFYSGASRKAYDKVKSVITDDTVTINEKNLPAYSMANWATVIACSNSMDALYIDSTDRRWFVPTVTEEEQPTEYWREFYAWFNGPGAGIVLRWAQEFVRDGNYVRTGDHAPGSERKDAVVKRSRSEGQELALGLAEALRVCPERSILRLRDIRQWIAVQRRFVRNGEADLGHRNLEKPATITAIMKKVPGITVWADRKQPHFGAVRDSVFMNFVPEDGATWKDIRERYVSDVDKIAPEPL